MVDTRLPFRAPVRQGFKIERCHALFVVEPKPQNLAQWLKLIAKRTAQSFRLMVGVQDYARYVQHMKIQHPEKKPMTEREFYQYCLNARFPSEGGKMGKCPC